eukprot:CAMPEP_0168617852 /NCGR_PEP_ID=MMETSP0449_2-20121227/5762_1 /TAXON_ID=1082188 /ORGANISM="Strombidium rassoulzadegani, Strain ras09" /LENGTH=235 /DNA_ID=CAMNT_0008658693 /DNA_START=305 /DNA_END=1008 /DNA_ORIENTATION=-
MGEVLVDGGQDDEAVLALLDEAVEAVLLVLVELDLLADPAEVEAEGGVGDEHLEGQLPELLHELLDLPVNVLALVLGDGEHPLDLEHGGLAVLLAEDLLVDLAPVALVLLLEHVVDARLHAVLARAHLAQRVLQGLEVLLDGLHDARHGVLVEVDDALEVELGAEHVEEDVLAVALVELGDEHGQLVEHGEALGGVARALHHRAHLRLQGGDLLLQLLVLLLELVALLLDRRQLL